MQFHNMPQGTWVYKAFAIPCGWLAHVITSPCDPGQPILFRPGREPIVCPERYQVGYRPVEGETALCAQKIKNHRKTLYVGGTNEEVGQPFFISEDGDFIRDRKRAVICSNPSLDYVALPVLSITNDFNSKALRCLSGLVNGGVIIMNSEGTEAKSLEVPCQNAILSCDGLSVICWGRNDPVTIIDNPLL